MVSSIAPGEPDAKGNLQQGAVLAGGLEQRGAKA
jgi:hypothetical protein